MGGGSRAPPAKARAAALLARRRHPQLRALASTAEIVAREDARRRIVEAVVGLEEPYRSTIVLRFLDGLPTREIAKQLCVPKATVRTRLARALDLLRRNLDARRGAAVAERGWPP